MAATPITLPGGIQLQRPLAEGGMGAVWLAHAPAERRDLAVKVLLSERARDPRNIADFFDELALVARLRHPNIVPVHAFGTIRGSQAQRGLPQGSPWLAMPLARGSLKSTPDSGWTWDLLAPHLRAVLDGLANLHANGIVHRDLKPANVLIGSETWLADFGLAVESMDESVSGTPAYMAPEQVRAATRDQGPPTDLYSFACMVWRLVTGQYVFRVGARGMLLAHLRKDPGAFEPRFPVPATLETWLRSLLQKRASDRPPSVAHARAAFPELALSNANRLELPPLRTAGAELLSLRPPRFVGRKRARGILREHLQRLVDTKVGFSLGLFGGEGIGKSRLLNWTALTAHAEMGFRLVHIRQDDVLHGLLGALWNLDGMDAEDAAARIRDSVVAENTGEETLEDWCAMWANPDDFGTPQQLKIAVGAVLAWAEHQRLVLLLDDLQGPVPGLQELIGTLKDRPVATILAARAPTHLPETSHRIHLGRLSDNSIRHLISTVVRSEPVLRERLTKAVAGNPGFAVQTLVELHADGRLQSTPTGFHAEGEVPLPRRVQHSFAQQAERLFNEFESNTFLALVGHAAIGEVVPIADWQAVCRAMKVEPCRPEMRDLENRGFVALRPEGWRFASRGLADALVQLAESQGYTKIVHRAVLGMLEARYATDHARLSRHYEALGMWERTYTSTTKAIWSRLYQGQYRCGWLVDRLNRAAEALSRSEELAEARRVRALWFRVRGRLDDTERCLEQAFTLENQVSTDQRALLVMERSILLWERDEVEACVKDLEWAVQLARSPRVEAEVSLALGGVLRKCGNLVDARPHLERTIALEEHARPMDPITAALGLAQTLAGEPGFEEALAAARAAADERGYPVLVSHCDLELAEYHLEHGRLDAAEAALTLAAAGYERAGNTMRFWCVATLAWIGFLREDLDQITHHLADAGPAPTIGGKAMNHLFGTYVYLATDRIDHALTEAENLLQAAAVTSWYDPVMGALLKACRELASGDVVVFLDAVADLWREHL